jgi:hypothetical protein
MRKAPLDRTPPSPSLIGRLVRILAGLVVTSIAWSLFTGLRPLLSGDVPATSWPFWLMLAVLAFVSGWVLAELLQKRIALVTDTLLILGALVAAGADWTVGGSPFGAAFGAFVWVWGLVFALLLGPALFLAAILGTPGCEMRASADLWTRLRGGDPRAVACRGWVDRFDRVRVFGR